MLDEKDLVAYLDILGFKEMVNDYLNGNTIILKIIENALKEAETAYEIFAKGPVKINTTQFSDCSCIYLPDVSNNDLNPECAYPDILISFLYYLREFQLFLLDNKIYVRGGISYGYHYENKNLIFSKALIDAYELESKKAIYPRLIFDKKLGDLIKDYYSFYKEYFAKFGIDKSILVDWDGVIFLNPFYYARSLDKLHKKRYHPLVGRFSDEYELKTKLEDVDLSMMEIIGEDINGNIEKFRDDPKILKKYVWLQELIQWNIDPDSSKIKFDYFLK